jgi:inner membrane protein
MASAISHAVAALGVGAAFYRPSAPKPIWIAGVACAVLPDLDVIGFRFGIHYGDFWGHRGFTHSLVFALLVAGVFTFWIDHSLPRIARARLFVYLFLATASHGLLDAMTNGGLGVAFFSPFENSRYFLPLRPIRVSPIGVTRFFTSRGVAILQSEIVWIWIPALLLVISAAVYRRTSQAKPATPEP